MNSETTQSTSAVIERKDKEVVPWSLLSFYLYPYNLPCCGGQGILTYIQNEWFYMQIFLFQMAKVTLYNHGLNFFKNNKNNKADL